MRITTDINYPYGIGVYYSTTGTDVYSSDYGMFWSGGTSGSYNLPSAAQNPGLMLVFGSESDYWNNYCYIIPNGTDTVSYKTGTRSTLSGGLMVLVSDGINNWIIIAGKIDYT